MTMYLASPIRMGMERGMLTSQMMRKEKEDLAGFVVHNNKTPPWTDSSTSSFVLFF